MWLSFFSEGLILSCRPTPFAFTIENIRTVDKINRHSFLFVLFCKSEYLNDKQRAVWNENNCSHTVRERQRISVTYYGLDPPRKCMCWQVNLQLYSVHTRTHALTRRGAQQRVHTHTHARAYHCVMWWCRTIFVWWVFVVYTFSISQFKLLHGGIETRQNQLNKWNNNSSHWNWDWCVLSRNSSNYWCAFHFSTMTFFVFIRGANINLNLK